MADSAIGDSSNHGSSFEYTQEKGSRNKRKYLSDFDNSINLSSLSLTEFPRYELLDEKFRNTLSELGVVEESSEEEEEVEEEEGEDEFQSVDWDDPIAFQLEELLSNGLCAIFQSAIKKVVERGYNEEVAEWAILRRGLCYGKDWESNIVEGALLLLSKEIEIDTSKHHHVFNDLQDLVTYTMLEMICVLRELKPNLTVGEAMWCLLIFDLNLALACAVKEDPLNLIFPKDIPPEVLSAMAEPKPSDISLPNPNKPNISKNPTHIAQNGPCQDPKHNPKNFLVRGLSHPAVTEEKTGCSRKGCLGNSKRDLLRQKPFHFEKSSSYKGRMSKGAFKTKVTSWSNMVVDKMKYSSNSSGLVMKSTYTKITTAVGVNVPRNHHPSSSNHVISATDCPNTFPMKDVVTALPVQNWKLSPPLQPETEHSPKTPDYYAEIPYDESVGKYMPRDDKDEMILTLVPHVQALQKELHSWTDWANEKVMQAARRLGKDKAELKTLKQEKEETEKFKKEKQILEDSTMKRLSEMEYAISNAAGQIEMANSTVQRLEVENSILKKEMEATRMKDLRSAANSHEAVLREQDTMKKAQLCEVEKGLLQEEFTRLKRDGAELQQQLGKAKGVLNQIEALWKQEEKEKLKLLTIAQSLCKERKHSKAAAKANEDKMRQNSENDLKQCKEAMKRLESEISQLRLKSESLKIEALRKGVDVSYGRFQTDPKENFGEGKLKPERECVMCLSDEISVVFVPCAHQVLCVKCNVLHNKQGMNDCPSCRTPIKRRINVRFAS